MKKTVRELTNECYDDERNWGHPNSRKMDLDHVFLESIKDYPALSLDDVINFKSDKYFLTVEFDKEMNPIHAYLDKSVTEKELGKDSIFKIYEDDDWNLLVVIKCAIEFCVERKNFWDSFDKEDS